jgi:hypothetical protein
MRSPGLSRLGEILCEEFSKAELGETPEETDDGVSSARLADPQQLLTRIDEISSGEVDQLLVTLLEQQNSQATARD